MARQSWWLALPAVAGGACLLVAVAFGGAVTVSGTAIAGPHQPPVPQAAALGGAGAVLPTEPPPVTKPAPPEPSAAPVEPVEPVGQRPGTVRLAKGGTATLVRQELGPDATLPIPNGVREATWWGAGLDATTGATVLAGHVDWKGQTGPFAELWNARDGDPVSVVDAAGRNWTYRVSRVETVAKGDLPARAEEFFGQSGGHRLVLVTCGGRWVGGANGYESNRVVIATRV
jgi:hypothetical protein